MKLERVSTSDRCWRWLQSRGDGVKRGRNNQFPANIKTLSAQQTLISKYQEDLTNRVNLYSALGGNENVQETQKVSEKWI